MIDVIREIEAVRRSVGPGRLPAGDGHTVTLSRTYPAPIDEVWDALTDPERIGRWFLPISGDYRLGGRYQFEGNAGGEILECDKPNRLKVSWVYMDTGDPADVSEVVLHLTPETDASTTLELVHTAIVPDAMWDQYGPGAVGVGWEGGLLGLELHLRGGSVDDPVAWQMGPEGRDFNTRSSVAWGDASRSAGVDEATVTRNVEQTTGFYVPPPEAS